MRKYILIIVLAIVAISITSKNFFHKSLAFLNITKECYKANDRFLEIFEQEGFDYKKTDQNIILDGLQKLADNNLNSDNLKIPQISHSIYFVPEQNSTQLNLFFTETMKVKINRLNSTGKDWQHYIWTNKAEFFPNEIKTMQGVEIKDIDEFKEHILYKYLSEAITKGNESTPYFIEAADLTRLMALQKFGGVYSDLDYEIYNANALFSLLKKFDFIAGRELMKEFSYYGNAFIATKANHPVINEALTRNIQEKHLPNYDAQSISRSRVEEQASSSGAYTSVGEQRRSRSSTPPELEIQRAYIKYPCSDFDRIYFHSPPLLTIAYFSKNNIDGNIDIILPTWMILNASFARNKNDNECNYKSVTKEMFDQREEKLSSLLKTYPSLITNEQADSNIYFSLKDRAKFEIIGADMFCGNWATNNKAIKRRKYYWSWKY